MGRVKKSFNEKYNSPFAVNMRDLMREYGVTQDTLAAKIGRTRQTVCQYVNGESEPGYERLRKSQTSSLCQRIIFSVSRWRKRRERPCRP